MNWYCFPAASLLCCLLSGCSSEPPAGADTASESSDSSQSAAARPVKTYPAKGVFLELVSADRSVFVHHEPIPGYMEEMTMYLKVAEGEDFESIKVGRQYRFELVVGGVGGTRIQNLVATGEVAESEEPVAELSSRWLAPPTMELGDSSPEFVCTASTGETITPAVMNDKVWAVTFIFTRCPLPDYCPLMTARFLEVEQTLSRMEVPNWSLLVITIDPDHDTLDVLNNYRRAYGVESPNVHFCRAEAEELRKIGDPLGLKFQADEFPIEHNLRTAVFDADGRLVEVFSGNQWTAFELVKSMRSAER